MGAGEIDKVQHDAALESLDDVDWHDESHALVHWANELDFDFDYYEGIIASKREQDSWGFATKILPRFQAMLRDELAAEAAHNAGVSCT